MRAVNRAPWQPSPSCMLNRRRTPRATDFAAREPSRVPHKPSTGLRVNRVRAVAPDEPGCMGAVNRAPWQPAACRPVRSGSAGRQPGSAGAMPSPVSSTRAARESSYRRCMSTVVGLRDWCSRAAWEPSTGLHGSRLPVNHRRWAPRQPSTGLRVSRVPAVAPDEPGCMGAVNRASREPALLAAVSRLHVNRTVVACGAAERLGQKDI